MEFATTLGAGTILTNAARKSQETAFYRNMEKLAAFAETLDLVIALENPGDGQELLLGSGIEAIAVLERLGSNRLKLNYDFSNVFTYSKGSRRPEQELASLLPCIGHLHLKNVRHQEGTWPVCGIDEGIIDYRTVFRQFPALWKIPMSIELPLRFGYDDCFRFVLRATDAAPLLEHIREVLADSLEYLHAMMPSTA
jgi:sugar phosphate isomerase/epimerase